jgi:hypothetical protein
MSGKQATTVSIPPADASFFNSCNVNKPAMCNDPVEKGGTGSLGERAGFLEQFRLRAG